MKPNVSFFLTVNELVNFFMAEPNRNKKIYVSTEMRKDFLISQMQGRIKISGEWVKLVFEDVGGDVWCVSIPKDTDE